MYGLCTTLRYCDWCNYTVDQPQTGVTRNTVRTRLVELLYRKPIEDSKSLCI
jgi:hypothetical protein